MPSKNQRSAAAESTPSPGGEQFHAFRETVESVVIAFVLAFLFRTFEAEAFVIPTGSMSPSLQGQHKDVSCPQCGHRFRASASEEGEPTQKLLARLRSPGLTAQQRSAIRDQVAAQQVVGGMCPMCRYTLPMRPDIDLPDHQAAAFDVAEAPATTSYPGDRILVNKYGFSFHEPERWDVVVFKFPGDGNMNYIKRLVGLPNERLRIFHGDLFVQADGAQEYEIAAKPPEKARAMLQEVHSTEYDPSSLYQAGWPLRWSTGDSPGGSWSIEADASESNVQQRFAIEQSDEASWAWLHYEHLLPTDEVWQAVQLSAQQEGDPGALSAALSAAAKPALITDFNPYNARISRGQLMADRVRRIPAGEWGVLPNRQGMHWVGDLGLACDVRVDEARGELALDVVEAGVHFRCIIDLASGEARLEAVDGRTGARTDLGQSAPTSINGPGSYSLLFANVDDQLLLWVDGDVVEFDDRHYDPTRFHESRQAMLPWTSESDRGDLAPCGVAARGAQAVISRLAVLRDIYYIAAAQNERAFSQGSGRSRPDYFIDYHRLDAPLRRGDLSLPSIDEPRRLFSEPELWERFATRRAREFSTADDQFFVLGDNSPESQDCRLWNVVHPETRGKPGGEYLDRRLLIGEAVCVFWPHSWGNWFNLPLLRILPGFPAFGDMRLVR